MLLLETVIQSFRHYVRLQLFGVLIPGLMLLGEILFWTLRPEDRRDPVTLLTGLSSSAERIELAIVVLAAVVVLLAAYVLGFIARQIVWRIVLVRSVEPSWADLESFLHKQFDPRAVALLFDAHPPLADAEKRDGGGVRRYCKTWLKVNEPLLGVDHLEGEVNVIFSFVLPSSLAPFVIVSWLDLPSVEYWLVAAGAGAAIGFILAKTGRDLRRKVEPFDTLANFVLSQWIRRFPQTDLPNAEPPDVVGTPGSAGVPVPRIVHET